MTGIFDNSDFSLITYAVIAFLLFEMFKNPIKILQKTKICTSLAFHPSKNLTRLINFQKTFPNNFP